MWDYWKFVERPKEPMPPKPHDDQSLTIFLDWLLQAPNYRMFAYPSRQPGPEDTEQFIKSLLRPLPHEDFRDKLARYSPKEFERLVANFLQSLGGGQVIAGEQGTDGGIDLKLRTSKGYYIVQCKRWKAKVGVPIVREVYGVATNVQAKGAFIISTSKFTNDAIYYTENLSPRVGLIDGEELFNLMTLFTPTIVEDILGR